MKMVMVMMRLMTRNKEDDVTVKDDEVSDDCKF